MGRSKIFDRLTYFFAWSSRGHLSEVWLATGRLNLFFFNTEVSSKLEFSKPAKETSPEAMKHPHKNIRTVGLQCSEPRSLWHMS